MTDLESHRTVHPAVMSQKHRAHTTLTQSLNDTVRTELLRQAERGSGRIRRMGRPARDSCQGARGSNPWTILAGDGDGNKNCLRSPSVSLVAGSTASSNRDGWAMNRFVAQASRLWLVYKLQPRRLSYGIAFTSNVAGPVPGREFLGPSGYVRVC